jgi:coproporphyrinogen III oxidase
MKSIFSLVFSLVFLMPALLLASLPDNLTEEQAQFAKKMEKFVDEMEAKVLETMDRLNGSKDVQTKTFEFETADYVVKVARGPVIAKGGFMRSLLKKALPPMIPEPIWCRYLQIDIYPKTPLVGMLHVAMNFMYGKDGRSSVGGIMDITPGTIIEEDLSYVKGELDKVFAKRGLDINPFREPLSHGNHKDRLKASCVGVSFYRRPGLEINEENFTLVKESVETMFNAYMKVLEKRKDQKFSAKDTEAMFDMRRRWLEKEFQWDPFPSKGLVPYEVWSFQDLPPEVRF